MHKKYHKYGKRDVLHKTSSHKKTHVKEKHKKETTGSLNELIKVPQNSKCDIKNNGDIENVENLKSRLRHKEKNKHKKSDQNKSAEPHGKKHEKQSVHNTAKTESLLFQNERLVKHKENNSKKEKRDKERLNKIEKYLEGLNEVPHKNRGRNRSFISLRNTENLESRKRHIRREKTFNGEISRPREFNPGLLETKKPRDHKRKEKEAKKQKHRENKRKDSNIEREIKNPPKQVYYCQIGNPLEIFTKHHEMEKHSPHSYKDNKPRSPNKEREHASSKVRSISPRDEVKVVNLEKNSKNPYRCVHSRERKSFEQTKHSQESQQKSKRKTNHRITKETESKVNLGPYDKYFVIDKKSESDDENKHHRRGHREKSKENYKRLKNDNVNENVTKEERKHKKRYPEKRASKAKEIIPVTTQDQFREKIEDDIKSYFTKIQTLIDKKLEFILRSSASNKTDSAGPTSSRKHRSRKHDNTSSRDNEQGRRTHKSHASILREKKQLDEELRHQRHRKSPIKPDKENFGITNRPKSNERERKHHKRHSSSQPDFHKRNHLLNMIENPSAYSVKSKKSSTGEKAVMRQMKSVAKLRTKHTHKVRNNDNSPNQAHRERSLGRRKIISDEVTRSGVANDFALVDIEHNESHGKKYKKRPFNLECKTISIIGIPSQMKESIIFNETQTTTSLNINHLAEDPVEKKKKTKRFKLYYKYSLANNSCGKSDSDKSSDGRSIVSDSYRVVSCNSEPNSEVCLNHPERDITEESRKIVFVMKRESLANISGDTSDNQIAIEHFSRKCRKQRPISPTTSKLNNIVEEPSNMSCLDELDKTLESMNNGFHCKYFNVLNSSSSICNLHLMKKSAVSDWNIPMGKCKCRIFDNSDKISTVKIYNKSAHEKEDSLENNFTRNINNQRSEKPKKCKHKRIRDFETRFTSKSDIDISYDSLHTNKTSRIKLNKSKQKVTLSSHLIESSTYTPSEIYTARNHADDYPKKQRHFPNDYVYVDRSELKMKESVCQTEFEIDKDALDDLRITNAYKKYYADRLESHQNRKQEEAKCKGQDMNAEDKIPQQRKREAHLEVTRIPSLLNKRRVEKISSEINTPAIETSEEFPQKYTKSGYIPEIINSGSPLSETNTPARGIAEEFPQKCNRRSYIPERKNTNPKFIQKKLTDVGVEVALLDEKLNRQSEISPKRKKSFSRDTDVATVDVKVNTPDVNFSSGVGINAENIESTGLVESPKSPTPKQGNRINRDPPNTRSLSQQSRGSTCEHTKRPRSRGTEVIKSVRLPVYPKAPASVSGRCKVREIERPFSAREKSVRNEKDFLQKVKMHEVKRSASVDIKKRSRFAVKCAKTREIHAKKCISINASRLTVSAYSKSRKQSRSTFGSYKSKGSTKRAGLTTPKSNGSFGDMPTETEESKLTSLVGFDKYMYGTKFNLAGASHARSLDRYMSKCINERCHHSSRLFLTKDYIPQLNTYQRRKLYSESLRRKMKKNSPNQNVIAPQIFEVRYLTFENETLNDVSEATAGSNATSQMNKFNSTARKHFRKKSSPPRTTPVKKSRKHVIRSKESVAKFSSRNTLLNATTDVDKLSKSKKKQLSEVKIEDIFIKGKKVNEDEEKDSNFLDVCEQLTNIQSSSIILKDDITSLDEFKLGNNKSNFKFEQNCDSEANFMHLIDYLCKSIVDHCSSEANLPREDCQKPPQLNEDTNNTKQRADVSILNDIDAQHQAKSSIIDAPCQTSVSKNEPKGKSNDYDGASSFAANSVSCESSENTKCMGKLPNDQHKLSPRPVVSGQVSCPALAGTASSFEFLYEDESKELSKRAILESLTKPWDTILGYALHCNDAVVIRREVHTSIANKIDQISNSPTDSGESGYYSHCSKKCSSAASFFKRPYVAALFKSPPVLDQQAQDKDSKKSFIESDHSLRTARYNYMSEKCQEYAQKVRIHSQNREESEDTFQEIPLNILLQRKSSTVFGQCNSDCSICKEYVDETDEFKTDFASSENECENVAKSNMNSRAFSEEESFNTFGQNENKLETLIYYGNPRCKPSLEIVKLQKSKINSTDVEFDTLEEELNDCPMVLSNTNLHKCSLTLLDARQSKDYIKEEDVTNNENTEKSSNKNSNYNHLKVACDVTVFNEFSVNDPTEGITNDETAKGNDEATDDDNKLEDTVNSDDKINMISSFSINAPETKKLMAKRFFENLLRVYEKEMAVTTRLFQDDDFFVNDLLSFVNDAEEKKKRKGKLRKIRGYLGHVFASKNTTKPLCSCDIDKSIAKYQQFESISQKKLKMLAFNAKRYFSLFVQAVKANENINDEIKICGLLKILQRIESGDFTILRTNEEVNFENEIKHQVKEAFINIYEISVKEAKKHKRTLTIDDLKLIKAFVSKYRIGLLSKTDIIATYIGRGIFKTEKHLSAAVTYLIRIQTKDVDLKEFEEYCKICTSTKQ